jgi:hypothetical protein
MIELSGLPIQALELLHRMALRYGAKGNYDARICSAAWEPDGGRTNVVPKPLNARY